MLGMCYNNASMKTLAKNANDFASVRTMDKGGLRLIGPARTGRSAPSLKTVLALKVDANPRIARMWLRGLTRYAHAAHWRLELAEAPSTQAKLRRAQSLIRSLTSYGIEWALRGECKYYSSACSTEGAYLHRHAGKWYLFVSEGGWSDHTYRISVGRADALDGEFLDKAGRPMRDGHATPILQSEKNDDFFGPGHNGEIMTLPGGRTYVFYHCHWRNEHDTKDAARMQSKSGYVPRPLFLQEILWDAEGWPYFENGGKPQKNNVLRFTTMAVQEMKSNEKIDLKRVTKCLKK